MSPEIAIPNRSKEVLLRKIALKVSLAVIFIAALVLTGWTWGSQILVTVLPGWPDMKDNAALCFALSGFALFLVVSPEMLKSSLWPPVRRGGIFVAVFVMVALCLATEFEYLFNIDLHLDELLVSDSQHPSLNYYPGRMSPISAFNFICIGVALFLLARNRSLYLTQFMAACVAFSTLVVLTGTSYGLEPAHAGAHYTTVALHTNLCFSLLAAGLLCASGTGGIMKLLTDSGSAGIVVRKLLPMAILVPMAIGWVGGLAEYYGLFSMRFGVSIFSLSTIAAFTLVIWWSADYLHQSEEGSREVESRLRQSLQRYTFLADKMPQMIWTARPDGNLDYYNQRWFDYSGVSLDQMEKLGWTFFVHPEDLPGAVETWKKSITTGCDYDVDFRIRRGSDGSYRWHLGRAFPMRNDSGEIVQWVGTCTDIDDQRKTSEVLERTVAERTARLQGLVEELEAFSYSISHDLRAPLRAMVGFSNVLKEDHGPKLDAVANSYLDRISAASRRMDELIKDVLTYSRVSRGDFILAPINPNKLITEITTTYPHLAATAIDVFIMQELPLVMANESALTQCISNILSNAAKFVAPGVKPKVTVSFDANGGRVRLWFKDNGIGIPPEQFATIFDIFHRVDHRSEGTGIGLAIVRKAVQKMGGNVGVESEVGHGTSFWLDLQGI